MGVPVLIHLNGPPAVGKSTVAAALVRSRPLALNLDIDELRVRLGGWQNHDESKRVARALGFRLAEWHLSQGFDVVLPQLLVRPEVIQDLKAMADRAGARFQEVILRAPRESCIRRLKASRALVTADHPRDAFDDDDIAARIAYCCEAMEQMQAQFTGAVSVETDGDLEQTIARVEAVLTPR